MFRNFSDRKNFHFFWKIQNAREKSKREKKNENFPIEFFPKQKKTYFFQKKKIIKKIKTEKKYKKKNPKHSNIMNAFNIFIENNIKHLNEQEKSKDHTKPTRKRIKKQRLFLEFISLLIHCFKNDSIIDKNEKTITVSVENRDNFLDILCIMDIFCCEYKTLIEFKRKFVPEETKNIEISNIFPSNDDSEEICVLKDLKSLKEISNLRKKAVSSENRAQSLVNRIFSIIDHKSKRGPFTIHQSNYKSKKRSKGDEILISGTIGQLGKDMFNSILKFTEDPLIYCSKNSVDTFLFCIYPLISERNSGKLDNEKSDDKIVKRKRKFRSLSGKTTKNDEAIKEYSRSKKQKNMQSDVSGGENKNLLDNIINNATSEDNRCDTIELKASEFRNFIKSTNEKEKKKFVDKFDLDDIVESLLLSKKYK